MKRLVLTGLLIGCGLFVAEAQKVSKEGTMFVIECVGMPVGSYTKTVKPRVSDGTNTTQGSETSGNLGSAVNNKQIAYKFEVAAVNNNASGTNWLSAVNLCAGLSGGNWRLPTQRELQLVLILSMKLNSLAGFTPFTDTFYWSATESVSDSWDVNFASTSSSSVVTVHTRITTCNVRCIRDITD